MISNLEPVHDSRKSFYQKAQLIDDQSIVKLKSYNTIVAELDRENKTIKVKGYYSATTARHINEFLLQNGVNKLSKKEMDTEPTITLNK